MEVSRNLCFYSSTEICSAHHCSLLFGRSQFRISVPRLDVIGLPTMSRRLATANIHIVDDCLASGRELRQLIAVQVTVAM